MDEDIYEYLLNYTDIQSKYFEQITSLELEKIEKFNDSPLDKVKEESIKSYRYIIEKVKEKVDEFRDFGNYFAIFYKKFSKMADVCAKHATKISINNAIYDLVTVVNEYIDKYKKLKTDINKEKTDIKKIIEEVILKSDFKKPLCISNYLMDTELKNAKELIEFYNLGNYYIREIKSKIYNSCKNIEYIEMLEFIKHRFDLIYSEIVFKIDELYSIKNKILENKTKFSADLSELKNKANDCFCELKDYISDSNYHKLGDLIVILEDFNPCYSDLSGEKNYKIVKNWVYEMKSFIYKTIIGER